MRTIVDPHPDPALRAWLFAAIDAYNDAATQRTEPALHLAIPLRDAAGAVEGGLVGISYYDWLIVYQLFVPRSLRGHGIGTQLMRAAETVAVRRGCRGLWLDTYSFQARPFYERLGFRAFARFDDFPPGHQRFLMAHTAPRAWPMPALDVQETEQEAAMRPVVDGLRAFNDAAAGAMAETALAVRLEDEAGRLRGALWTEIGRGWMYLDLFVLDAAARRGGHGGRMLALVEAEARARGCVGVALDTYSFQALPFYRRHGYQVVGELPDYPAPHRRHFLMKRLIGAQGEA